ncbi:ribosomal protein L21 [Pseudooceanicola batsensis HTCC2597]|uniref:Large ribosomal subunit protein bL21 n=1 Tax=Pseudooceanicola batsensis (strain ATCC BAA-863 / DSM 15984 / KCTC 12145 / HTCC2597) TaxID=252305 RepID=A3TXG3_PSEBH|nr:50S ribosomal protein L21 [Pseudooceanicola batsensis]EAQ03523.1 ribosomal protein L21 [Pseudooceanicola batsensis HTCC2597]
MFAVLKTGGKQYRVKSGDMLRVEKLAADAGEKVQFNEILMVGGDDLVVGAPLVDDAGVQAEVVDQIKGDKLIHYVKRRRKHSSQRKKGHRQQLTLLRVTDILASGAGKSGVKAAVGASALGAPGPKVTMTNKTEEAELAAEVHNAAPEATAEAAPKAEPKKAAPKKAAKTDGADDLKELSGVGPALEKKLHEAGVTTFAQIAAWTEADIAEMDEKLSFKGRIEREGWVEQAKEKTK